MEKDKGKLPIAYLYRKPLGEFHSIEEVFKNIKHAIGDRITSKDYFLPNSSAGTWNKIKNLFYVAQLKDPILHVTGEAYYAALLFRGSLVVTIHDIAEIFKGNIVRRFLIKMFWFQLVAWKSKKIIIISEKSKKEFIDNIQVDRNKVEVITNPISTKMTYHAYLPNDIPRLLQVGTKDNKNLHRLFEALKGCKCHLHIIGPVNDDHRSLLKANKISYSQAENLSFEEVVDEYKKADIVTFVSTYEGFGLPIIEAQAIGRAVVTSNISPMKEVAGDGAVLVDPFSIDSIREGIITLIEKKELRLQLIEKGKLNIRRYSGDHVANAYLNVYDQLANA